MDIMPPDNQLPPHHAPNGLKIWLTVFAVVLVGALAYLVWAQNTALDATDSSDSVIKKTTTETTTPSKATTPTKTTTTTKSTTPPVTSPCPDKKTYTMPIEKLTVCYPEGWESSFTAGDSSFSFKRLTSAAGGSASWANISVAIVKTTTASSHEYKVESTFTLNGKIVYLMSPVGGANDEGNRLSSCSDSKLCDIPAKNIAGSFLEVRGYITTMISPTLKTPLGNDALSLEAVEIIKSLHY